MDPRTSRLHPHLSPPELVTVLAADRLTVLYGALYRPDPEIHGPGPYPTLVSVYGGPQVQTVKDSWHLTADMRAQYYRDHGYLVFKLDNRGSSGRGIAFEAAIKRDMGNVEVADQVAGIEWLVSRRLADPRRVGIYGWSYGGYLSAMALMKAPDVFSAAVAGAPVTFWEGYDSHYTERYMGRPEENPKGYESANVLNHCGSMRGKLLILHGMIDENVHFRHSARLVAALCDAGKRTGVDYSLTSFPNERHVPRNRTDRVHMERSIFDFFQRCFSVTNTSASAVAMAASTDAAV